MHGLLAETTAATATPARHQEAEAGLVVEGKRSQNDSQRAGCGYGSPSFRLLQGWCSAGRGPAFVLSILRDS